MGMFPEAVEFVKVDKFVIKHKTRPWDSYWNIEKLKWGGLIEASRLTEEELKTVELREEMVAINYDEVIGLK